MLERAIFMVSVVKRGSCSRSGLVFNILNFGNFQRTSSILGFHGRHVGRVNKETEAVLIS